MNAKPTTLFVQFIRDDVVGVGLVKAAGQLLVLKQFDTKDAIPAFRFAAEVAALVYGDVKVQAEVIPFMVPCVETATDRPEKDDYTNRDRVY